MSRNFDDERYAMETKGSERSMRFLRPYRHLNELNPIEQMKLDRHPFEVAEAIVSEYSSKGVDALMAVPGEVERLKWVGLYPQKQGGDAFMMRIKVPGGVLTAPQVREIGFAAEAFAEGPEEHPLFGNRYADITTRQTIQLHWLTMADIPRMWQRFAAVGLTTLQACGDCARNVTCCPVSGVDRNEVVPALPVAQAISDFFTGNREYANLPRKFKIAIAGCTEDCSRVEINDIGLWPARRRDGSIGFNVLAGGGLSDGERFGSDLDISIASEQAVELTRAIAQVFGEIGNREHRGLARMRYLVQELGPEGYRQALADRVRFELEPAGEELTTSFRGDHVGVHPQVQEGLNYVGLSVPVGRIAGRELIEMARLAELYGDGTIRFGIDQNAIVSGIPTNKVDAFLAEELLERLSPAAGPFTRGIVTCTGSEFCRYAIVETKERAVRWAADLDSRLATAGVRDLPPIRTHFSGCSASCAQPQIGDIGLRGDTAHVGDRIEEGVDIGLGGTLGPEASFIDWISGAVPVTAVPDALERVATSFASGRAAEESFASWVRRTSNDTLRSMIEERQG
jgi:ferredoxin-nitrite reductase